MSSMVQQNAQMGGLKRAGEAPGVWAPTSLRVKRSMLGGRRIIGGPSTPVPRWKLYENPFYDGIAAAAAAAAQQQSANGGGRNVAVSARKLAATLWELQELPLSLASSKSQACPCAQYRPSPTASKRSRDHLLALADNANANSGQLNPSPQESPRHSSYSFVNEQAPADVDKESMVSVQQPSKGPAWDSAKKSSVSSSRQVAAMRSHVHRLLERRADSRLAQIAYASANPASLMVLNRIRGLEEQQHQQMPPPPQQQIMPQPQQVVQQAQQQQQQQVNSTPSSVVAALRMEVERARSKVHELEVAQKSARREIDALLKKMSEEKAVWRNKEQEKIRQAVQTVKLEMEEEKKVRRRVESVNRKMSRELVEANLAVAKAVNELERERKARELMEDVCDELAREIGEDKAEVEVLKRESAKVREEVEEERKMLQMAEVWREERVQMKLAEARLEIEEKSAALDHLKVDLEAFLHKARKSFHRDSPEEEEASFKEAEELKMQVDSLNLKEVFKSPCFYPEADGAASDLYEVEAPGNDISADERPDWGWGAVHNKRREATQLQGHAGELGHKLESREQVLERLRRKYSDQNGHLHHLHSSNKEETQEDSSRQWEAYTSDPQENDRDGGSDWNSQSDGGARGDDTKEEDGSQWESASDQDIEAMESNNSRPSTRGGRAGADELLRGPAASDAAAEVHCGGYESMSSPQTSYIINNVNINNITQQHQLHQHHQHQQAAAAAAELSSGDDLWKVASSSPLSRSKVQSEDRSRGEGGSRNSLGRGMLEVSRNSHMRLAAEQGTASPSRDWRSPDRGNPHIARGIKGFIEWPKMSRENAVKGKIVDSKVEKTDRRILRQKLVTGLPTQDT
ncbi:hypothetical protein Mapa_007076 [Marchantia paleacea]|nr:hypothetical protein Mapa_007076 [Marchantia paleacea]